MNELAELEQAERIKGWCREYGVGIMLGIVFAIVGSIGWHYWQQTRENNAVNAAMVYESFVASIQKNNLTTVEAIAKSLLQNYPKTPYASLAALQLAKQAVNQNNLSEAENKLIWVIQHGKSESLRAVARTRLARVLFAENQAERALKMLDEYNDNVAYEPLILEEKGDIFQRLGNLSSALQNYLAAEKLFSESAIDQPLLSMKISNLTKSN
ncbi:transmembrane protein [Candidatus Rickettsiella viridis]|uniref:Ancillary SecYEG translocon subunit n=1 Tax=Candidatus Rickettsiella viridis TaxID=676208 RepID=A0A2Z5V2Q1_9COXI|nr:tetratricopeptide repeat protein [Candidatus Rickettsiella viridis]BBB14742.1 transmembrane protein [Candidatus Rickettsiella viridis]